MQKKSPLSFTRTKWVGIQTQDQDLMVAHGMLHDNIYGMSVDVAFDLKEGVIRAVQAEMIRFTTYRCHKARDVVTKAAGMALGPDLENRIRKEVGRAGCRHVADILIECCHALPRALLVREMQENKLEPQEAVEKVKSLYPYLAYLLEAV